MYIYFVNFDMLYFNFLSVSEIPSSMKTLKFFELVCVNVVT